ncbi:murein L,D-transpeptidase family protein [Palleronia sp. LCG004]|uniref:L,D-transpeptidase family protein n=1 Tax=Palleronia sp. LCG004 TaxID=3079304 RepID=UPI0029436C8A|nr:L,D-transpeptidase family protein [Palleronia sp. LCG004]WOI55967.1 L,D-transpeptidase family protein [Palleronia sp. LCG004]
MSLIRMTLAVLALAMLSACGDSKFRSYDGPEVTRVVVFKTERVVQLMHRDTVLKRYGMGLGFAPQGHKRFEGDGRTPEGHYYIDRRNPNSNYHLSIGISYPNVVDRAQADALGLSPGGNIFIHGVGKNVDRKTAKGDWTAGCIAVQDREMEEIYAMVRDGTPITIYP